MSPPESPTRRRPVPPPKTESQARLREDLTSPGRQQYESPYRNQSDALATGAQKEKAMENLTLPPGWDLRNKADVKYHTHVAKRMD